MLERFLARFKLNMTLKQSEVRRATPRARNEARHLINPAVRLLSWLCQHDDYEGSVAADTVNLRLP